MGDADYEEVDVLLCLLVAQVARHQRQADRGDGDWVSMNAVEVLCQRIGHLGAAAIERGWHQGASQRGLLEVRESPNGSQVRLDPSVAATVGLDLGRRKPAKGRLRWLLRLFRSD